MASRRDPLRSQPFTPTTIRDARDTYDSSRYGSERDTYDSSRYEHVVPTSRVPRRLQDGQQTFPSHPSVRIPPNVRTKGMPMGAGVAPRPSMASQANFSQDPVSRPRITNTVTPNMPNSMRSPASSQNNASRPRATNTVTPNMPNSTWESPNAASTSQRTMHNPPPVPLSLSSSQRRYNMTQSYVSSVGADTPELRQSYPERESHYPEDDLSPRPAYPSSKVMPQFEFPTPDNRATMQTMDSYDQFQAPPKAKPRPIDTSLKTPVMPKPGEISPASTRATAMNALSQAIAVGIKKPSAPVSPMTSRGASRPVSGPTSPQMRMPFDDDMSMHTTNEDLDPPELKDAPPVPTSKLNGRNLSTSPGSATSDAPILGLGIGAPGRGMSTKRNGAKRPPQLDINAVRDMEARGSTTSLTDLIKRATKLASNLDRGKTASRLGMLDMFGRSSERLGTIPAGKRDSSMSDMLSAFPAPAIGTPRSEWPANEKGFNHSNTALPQWKSDSSSDGSKAKGARRRICGMSVPCFVVVLIILILLIAAAVLIPIFLIVVPRQNQNNNSTQAASAASCPQSNRCENSGTTIFTNGVCGCICSGGFTGPTCTTQGDDTCTTRDIRDGNTVYRAATMGQQVLQAFTDASSFNITLSATTVLSQFTASNIPCREQNDLLDVNDSGNITSSSTSTTANSNNANAKRDASPEPFIMLKGYEPAPLPVHPHRVEHLDLLHDHPADAAITPSPIAGLRARQNDNTPVSNDLVTEVNGIVFDTARQTAVSATFTPSPTRSASQTGLAAPTTAGTSNPTTSSSSPSSSDQPPTPDISRQLSFARVVVLYILDRSQSLSTALDAKNRLAKYFESVGSGEEVSVGMVAGLMVSVDMVGLRIV